jgi:hypothetical protein
MFGVLGLVVVGVALGAPARGMLPFTVVGASIGSFMFFLSLTGFLWAQAEANKARDNQL